MLIVDLLSRPLIYGVSKGAQLALKGTAAVGRAVGRHMSPAVQTEGGVTNYIGNRLERAVRFAGNSAVKTVEHVGSNYIDPAIELVRPFVRKENNLLGFKVRPIAGDMLFAGITGIGVLGGMREAQIGLVNYGPMETVTGEVLTPHLYEQQIKPKWLDNLGADGSLTLALHQLRR